MSLPLRRCDEVYQENVYQVSAAASCCPCSLCPAHCIVSVTDVPCRQRSLSGRQHDPCGSCPSGGIRPAQDERPFVSARRVMNELGEPYASNLEMVCFHTVSKGTLGECGMRGG